MTTLAAVLALLALAALVAVQVCLWRTLRDGLALGRQLLDALNVPPTPMARHGWAPPAVDTVLAPLREKLGQSEVRLAARDPLTAAWGTEDDAE